MSDRLGRLPWAMLLASACAQEPQEPQAPVVAAQRLVAGYDLGASVHTYKLPGKLREVSAIAAVDDDTVVCLQDEKGELFVFDLQRGVVRQRLAFGPAGDYEGLARVGDGFWVLRSDGQLLQLARSGEQLSIARTLVVEAPQREFEGVAWDAAAGVLVIAPKSLDKDADKDSRSLLAVDPATGRTRAQPYAVLDRAAVVTAAARLGVAVPDKARGDDERPRLRLRFSDVAVETGTDRLWLLSAVDRLLVVVDRNAAVVGLCTFDVGELAQPEGLTFLPGGDLVIASEGDGAAPVLRRFRRAR